MRAPLLTGLLATLVAGSVAAAQSQPASKQPARASVPSTPIFRGGFGRPIVINSSPPPSNTPAASPGPGAQNTSPQAPAPAAAPRITPAQAAAQDHDHADHDHGDHDHGGCTGKCQHDAPAAIAKPEDGDQAFAPGTPAADLVSRVKAARTRPESQADAYCMKCHPNGVPQSTKANRNIERGARAPDLRLANRMSDRLGNPLSDRGVASGAIRSGHGPDPQLSAGVVSQVSSTHESPRIEDGPPVALVGSAPAQAEAALRSWLKDDPGNFAVMRALAMAQLCLSKADDAADTMLEAYRSDPLLSREPIDPKAMGLDAQKLIRLANAAATAARKADTARGWLLASVMYEVQGSKPRALDALSLAKKKGLDADLCDWLKVSLSGPPARESEQPLAAK